MAKSRGSRIIKLYYINYSEKKLQKGAGLHYNPPPPLFRIKLVYSSFSYIIEVTDSESEIILCYKRVIAFLRIRDASIIGNYGITNRGDTRHCIRISLFELKYMSVAKLKMSRIRAGVISY